MVCMRGEHTDVWTQAVVICTQATCRAMGVWMHEEDIKRCARGGHKKVCMRGEHTDVWTQAVVICTQGGTQEMREIKLRT